LVYAQNFGGDVEFTQVETFHCSGQNGGIVLENGQAKVVTISGCKFVESYFVQKGCFVVQNSLANGFQPENVLTVTNSEFKDCRVNDATGWGALSIDQPYVKMVETVWENCTLGGNVRDNGAFIRYLPVVSSSQLLEISDCTFENHGIQSNGISSIYVGGPFDLQSTGQFKFVESTFYWAYPGGSMYSPFLIDARLIVTFEKVRVTYGTQRGDEGLMFDFPIGSESLDITSCEFSSIGSRFFQVYGFRVSGEITVKDSKFDEMKGAFQFFGPSSVNLSDCTFTDHAGRVIHSDQYSVVSINANFCFFYEVNETSTTAFIEIEREESTIRLDWCCFQGVDAAKYGIQCASGVTVTLGYENCFSSSTGEIAIRGVEPVTVPVCDANAHYDCRMCRRACPTAAFSGTRLFSGTSDPSESDNFNDTRLFSGTRTFTGTSGFRSTASNWTVSHLFPQSAAIAKSQVLPESDNFPDSLAFSNNTALRSTQLFSGSTRFQRSSEFPVSDALKASSALEGSENLSPSKPFNTSKVIPKTQALEISNRLNETDLFNRTNTFEATAHFSPSPSFTPSPVFSDSLEFNVSQGLTMTSPFTGSQVFDVNGTYVFTPSPTFSSTPRFSPSSPPDRTQTFTESEPFNATNTFTASQALPTRIDPATTVWGIIAPASTFVLPATERPRSTVLAEKTETPVSTAEPVRTASRARTAVRQSTFTAGPTRSPVPTPSRASTARPRSTVRPATTFPIRSTMSARQTALGARTVSNARTETMQRTISLETRARAETTKPHDATAIPSETALRPPTLMPATTVYWRSSVFPASTHSPVATVDPEPTSEPEITRSFHATLVLPISPTPLPSYTRTAVPPPETDTPVATNVVATDHSPEESAPPVVTAVPRATARPPTTFNPYLPPKATERPQATDIPATTPIDRQPGGVPFNSAFPASTVIVASTEATATSRSHVPTASPVPTASYVPTATPPETVSLQTQFPRATTDWPRSTVHPGTAFPSSMSEGTPESREDDDEDEGSTGLLVGSILMMVVLLGLVGYAVFKEKERKDENRARRAAQASREADIAMQQEDTGMERLASKEAGNPHSTGDGIVESIDRDST
jgi:hypothetical protein